MNIMKYFFFNFYKYFSKGDYTPLVSTLTAMAIFTMLIIFNIIYVVEHVFQFELLEKIPSSSNKPLLVILLIFILYLILYRYFLKNKTLEYYQNMFRNLPGFLLRGGVIITYSILFTLVLLLIVQNFYY